MKILHLYDEHCQVGPGKGSVSKFVYNLARQSAEAGHSVTVLERQWEGLSPYEEREGVEFVRFDLSIGSAVQDEEIPYNEIRSPVGLPKFVLDRTEFALRLRSYLQTEHFDVLHVHLPFTANILVHLLPRLRKKMVYTAHIGEEEMRFNFDDGSDSPLFLKIISPDIHLMERVSHSVVLNPDLAEKLRKRGIEDISIIPNGVNTSRFNADPHPSEETPMTVFFAGTITHRKGVDVLLNAAKIVNKAIDEKVVFRVAGDTAVEEEFVEECRKTIHEENLEGVFVFEGFVPEEKLRKLYENADIFVLPSREEGFGMALTEALATSTPAVASNVGGIPLQVEDGYNGYLFDKEDYRSLADKILKLINNQEERLQMAKNARKVAEEKFQWESVAEEYISLYQEEVAYE
ncbi:hypothetical protein HTG_00940 [Natrinema mahii]|nr:hypothetical protein HTG_00940 [Natrinema mahii]